ncbi:hypothetical protein AUC69_02385 [Methyloceanibacter superfactus]|uniref:Uncharacterized protein n=1 Tax=Methyloceanibacter superfactus TaxID=1774969 RepID=A0A1E3VPC5_9HYPH|nr:hypothetical protein [Methyloceanibacter superfactus]ODR95380.1 hypothetical protein AUC69_02385 [Methyloceanibacter superfactus]
MRAYLLLDVKGGDDDIGGAAILLQRAGMAHKRHRLSLDPADATEGIALEGRGAGGCLVDVPVVAIG